MKNYGIVKLTTNLLLFVLTRVLKDEHSFYNNYCFFLNITICLSFVNVPIKSVVLFLFFQPIRIHLCIDNQSRQYFPVKEVECVQPSYNRIHVVISFILINQSLQRLFGVKESERYIYILDDFMVQ